MPARAAREAAADWSGDRIAVYSANGRTAVAWRIRFDSESAALRALNAFARGALFPEDPKPDAHGRLPEFVPLNEANRRVASGQLCQARHNRGPFGLARHGRDLAVTLGPYQRGNGTTQSASTCAEALSWAQNVLQQK